jgi:small-conductance mechanosensitive channel
MNRVITGRSFLDELSADVAMLIAAGMERLLGPQVHNPALGPLTWADLGVFACFVLLVLLVNAVAASILRLKKRDADVPTTSGAWRTDLLRTIDKPLYLLIWLYGIYVAVTPLVAKFAEGDGQHPVRRALHVLFNAGFFIVLFWIFFRFTHVLERRLTAWAKGTTNKLDDLLIPRVVRSLRVVVPTLGIIFALPVIGLPQEYASVVSKGSSILIIAMLAWIFFQGVHLGEQAVLARYDITTANNLQARKVYTQVHVLGKTAYVIIAIFAVASVLMLFDEVRRLGTSLLASAGVIGVIAGFAAQRTIANLFAGFQLAMTQPIRLDDVVIVENEWGRVEEITLTYVVIHIWDDRRLVVPLSYFIEKPFQNWTRASSQLLGSVFLWADYSLPLDQVRAAAKEIIEASPLWDKRFWNVQVTDADEHAMQIRILATSSDSGKGWDLRCEIREKLIDYIRQYHPASLPRVRAEISRNAAPGGVSEAAPPSPDNPFSR